MKSQERLNRLKRRAEWLRSQSESTTGDISHTRAELSSLDWAIPILQAEVIREKWEYEKRKIGELDE